MTRASDTAKLLGAGATILDGTTISTADNTTQLTLTSTDADASVGPVMILKRDSSSPADDDAMGFLKFDGENSASEQISYASINARSADVTDGTEDGKLDVYLMQGGTSLNKLSFNTTETVFNEDSADVDFRVESNGNANMLFVDGGNDKVGIGTSSPSDKLDVDGSGSFIRVNRTDGEAGITLMYNGSNSTRSNIATLTNGDLQIETANTERMRIDSGGRFLLGTTSNVAASGNARFQLVQGNANWIHYSDNNNGSGGVFNHYLRFSGQSPDNNTSTFLLCEDSTAARLKIFSDGDVQNHDNSYTGLSDERVKEQITDASSQWEDIKSLQVRKFKFKTDVSTKGDSDELWRLGVIAQEVETAGMSGLVKSNPDMETDESGNIELTGTTTKSVKYSILYMKAVKALQEAMTRIETLETANTALEARIVALENA